MQTRSKKQRSLRDRLQAEEAVRLGREPEPEPIDGEAIDIEELKERLRTERPNILGDDPIILPVDSEDVPPQIRDLIDKIKSAVLGEHKPHVLVRDITLTPDGDGFGTIKFEVEPCGLDVPEGCDLKMEAIAQITPDLFLEHITPIIDWVQSLIKPEDEAAFLAQAEAMIENGASGTVVMRR